MGSYANATKSQDFQHKRKKDTNRKLRKLSKSPVMSNLNWNYQQKPRMRTGQTYQIFKEKIIPFLHKAFLKTEGKGLFPNSFCDNSITLFLKPKTLEENYQYL